MPTVKDFRRMALALHGVVERAHMGHPDFRANGRIFATIQVDPNWGMVKLTPVQQRHLLDERSEAFKPAAGAWGVGGATLVHFASADDEIIGEALTLAWQNAKDRTGKAGGKAEHAKKRTHAKKGRTP